MMYEDWQKKQKIWTSPYQFKNLNLYFKNFPQNLIKQFDGGKTSHRKDFKGPGELHK